MTQELGTPLGARTVEQPSMLFPAPLMVYLAMMLFSEFVKCLFLHVKNLSFKLHTETLPVKTWLRSRNIVSSGNDRLCDAPEAIEHCLIDCKDVIMFWDVLQWTLQKVH